MTPDDVTPLDEELLAGLLDADAALAEGRAPEPHAADETLGTHGSDGFSGYLDVLLRLGHRLTPGDADPEATTPPRLGRFEIRGTLGQGGFGIVYLARDPTLGRLVAFKVPRPEVVMDPEVRRRFVREARAAAGLDHPHLVAVHEAGEAGPLCYIASAYCPGPTLSAWLKARAEPVRPEAAARLVLALSEAVQHAHDHGILHRDIKPSNVILSGPQSAEPAHPHVSSRDEDLSPRLTDFGMAKIAEETGEETRTGMPLGSPPYMAPEQAAGRNRDLGPATDTYALGATLYELLTGRPPFRGESAAETLRMVIEADCVAPRVLRPGLPRDLETIGLKCLNKDPARRYPTARALGDDLRRFLDRRPILARPTSLAHRVAKWARRRPAHAAALVLASFVVIGALSGLVYRNGLVQRHAWELEREVDRADAGEKLARRHLMAFQLRQARGAIDARQVERAQDILKETPSAGEGPSVQAMDQGFAWKYLMSQARREVVVFSDRRSERVTQLTLSPDGLTLATGDADGTIRLRDPETGEVRLSLSGHKLGFFRLAFAPGGRRLASLGRGQPVFQSEVFLWDLPSGRLVTRLEEASRRAVVEVRFDPSGHYLWEVSRAEDGIPRVGLWNPVAGSDHRRPLWIRPIRSQCPPLSSDGTFFALEEQDRRFVVRDVRGKELGRATVADLREAFVALSPDGRLLAAAGDSPTVVLWDVVRGKEQARFEHAVPDPDRLLFSPDGRNLACSFRSGAFVLHDLIARNSSWIPPVIADPDPDISTCFSPDSTLLARSLPSIAGRGRPTQIWQINPWRQIASYPGMPRDSSIHEFSRHGRSHFASMGYQAVRWDFAAPRESPQPAGHADEAWSLAFSPDGEILASGSDDTDEPRTIKLWHVATGREIRGWFAGEGTVAALAFDPTGQVLASGHLGTPGEVRLWDPANGRRLATFPGHTRKIRALAFSPDGALLLAAGWNGIVRLWDMKTRLPLGDLSGHTQTVRSIAFSPDGTRFATASLDRTVRIWDVATGESVRLPWVEAIDAVAYAPDGRSLATADERGQITLWDPAKASRLVTIDGDDQELRCLAFSPDGRALAAAGKGQKIRLWDPVTAQELLTLEGHKAPINALAFSPDGSVLASCSHDGVVRLWRSGPTNEHAERRLATDEHR